MKRLLKWSLAAVVALAMTSCDDADSSYETLGILPVDAFHLVYPDQVLDSVQVVSTKNWEGSLTANWVRMDDLSGQTDGKMYSRKLPVFFEYNLTNQTRIAQLIVKANKNSVSHTFIQPYWLNITDPEPLYDFNGGNYPQKASFSKTVPASGGTISLSFRLYSPSTEITADPWITIQEEDRVLEAGEHTVQVNCTANSTGLPRNGQIRLRTQAGITTNIDITQKN